VRYPEGALSALAEAGIEYGGWLANYEVPRAYSSFKLTLHIPRSPYRHALPGIPTIRPFEALACGIPLISAPWEDTEGLFEPGRDFLVANNAAMMKKMIKDVLADGEMAGELAFHGLKTILKRHTCVHRVEDLFDIMRAAGWQRERTPKKGALVL
jgi:spore maturation protein CgeB